MERPKKIDDEAADKDKNLNLKVYCVTPKAATFDECGTSVFEIDIESSFNFSKNGQEFVKMIPVGNSNVKVTSKNDEQQSKSIKNTNKPGNPFIRSYYPAFSEAEEYNPITEVEFVEVQKQKAIDSLNSEDQAPSFSSKKEFQENLKNSIIASFISENKNLESMLKNHENKLDNSKVHLHHHEHHHYHYYTYDQPFDEGKSRHRRSEEDEKNRKNWVRNCKAHAEHIKKNFTMVLSANHSQITFTKDEPSRYSNNEVLSEADKPLESCMLARSQSSSSLDSVLQKKSEFLKSHTYSNVNLSKRNSEEPKETAQSPKSAGKNSSEGMASSSKHSSKTKSPPRSPASNHLQVPRAKSTTCDSASTVTNESSDSSFLNLEKRENAVKRIHGTSSSKGRTSYNSEDITQKCKQVHFEIWNAKLMAELKQIKKKLKRIEEKQMEKKKSLLQLSEKFLPESSSTHRISVYSSRTFILAPENVCLTENVSYKKLEENEDQVMPSRNLEVGINQYLISPDQKVDLEDQIYKNRFYQVSKVYV